MFHSRDWEGATALVGRPAKIARLHVNDAFTTYDRATYDSAGAFLVGELERLDPMLHEPLISTTWSRDIDLRTDVQMGDEYSSFTISTFGMVGGATPAGIAWAGKETTTLPRVTIDIGKKVNPLSLWAGEVAYTLPELESARVTGRPIDTQMLTGLNSKYNMDLDQVVYVGASEVSATGILNSSAVTNVSNVPNGATGSPLWANKTADEIRKDVNEILISAWAASGYTVPPTKLMLPPVAFGYIATTIVSSAGNETILSFLERSNILTAQTGQKLQFAPVKWLDKALLPGASVDRMVAYTQRPDYVRYPMVPLQAVPAQYDGLWVKVPYFGRLGVIEVVYPETFAYRDGIS